jgi:hypothetical protein
LVAIGPVVSEEKNMAATGNSPLSQIKWLLPSMLKYNMYFYLYIFSSPGQRPSELLPSLGVCRPSVASIDASYQVSIHLAERLQRRRFLKMNQLETSIACGGHVC